MSRSSALPDRLDDYAEATADRSRLLRVHGERATTALAEAAAACAGRLPASDPALERLGALALVDDLVAEFVAAVAAAFRDADAGPGFFGLPVTGAGPDEIARLLTEGAEAVEDLGWALLGGPGAAGGPGWDRAVDMAKGVAQSLLLLGRGQPATGSGASLLTRVLGPLARPAAIALSLGKVWEDGERVLDEGNPFRAFQRRGADYLADVQLVPMDLALGAFSVAPNEYTAIAVLAAVTTQVELRTLSRKRRQLGMLLGAVERGLSRARDEGVELAHDLTDRARRLADEVFDRAPGDPGPTMPLPGREAVELVLDGADAYAEGMDGLIDEGFERGHQAGEALRTGGEALLEGAADTYDRLFGE